MGFWSSSIFYSTIIFIAYQAGFYAPRPSCVSDDYLVFAPGCMYRAENYEVCVSTGCFPFYDIIEIGDDRQGLFKKVSIPSYIVLRYRTGRFSTDTIKISDVSDLKCLHKINETIEA